MRRIWVLVAVVAALNAGCSTVDGTPVEPSRSSATRTTPAKPIDLRLVVDTAPEVTLRDRAGEEYQLGPVLLTLDKFVRAYVEFDTNGGGHVVNLELPGDQATRFGELTQANVAKQLAMVVDGAVVSAPTIASPILGGRVVIQQHFSQQEATALLDAIGGER